MQFPLPLFSDDKSDVINNKDRGFISGQFIKYYLGFLIFFSQSFPLRQTLLGGVDCGLWSYISWRGLTELGKSSAPLIEIGVIQESHWSSGKTGEEREVVWWIGGVRLENK